MLGSYWMSSNSSVRSTTAPGVTARSSPTVNAFVSTIAGMCGGLRRSWTRLALPCTRLRPPVSSVAFSAAGFSAGKFVGASASRTFSALKRTRRSARSSRPGVGDQVVDRLARREVDLGEPAERRIPPPGVVLEAPVLLRRRDVGLADRDLGQLGPVARPAAGDLPGPGGEAGRELRPRHAREPAAGRPAAGVGQERVEARGTVGHQEVLASSGTSISRLRILPVGPLGSSSTNQILRGYL